MRKPITRTFYGWMRGRKDIDSHLSPDKITITFGLVRWNKWDKPCRITIEYPVRNPRVK